MKELHAVGPDVELATIDPEATPGIKDRDKAEKQLERNHEELGELQERLYAESKSGGTRSVLLVLQAMDTAGKGGIVRHVVGGVDPQGVKIHAFKKPTPEEEAQHFLWRVRKQLPAPGYIGVFDRSHYESVLIHRVRELTPLPEIEQRYGEINDFEAELIAGGTSIVKVMLHISSDEQKERLGERLDRPDKHWKYNPGDIDERMLWPAYQEAYEIALRRTTTPDAPWHVVPANAKWYARWVVQGLLLETLRELDPQWPVADFDVETEKQRLAAS